MGGGQLVATNGHGRPLGLTHMFITGAPGTGKTTLGRQVAEQTGLPLLSLDGLAAESGRGPKFPGTLEARRVVRRLEEPHVVEGASILGFPKALLARHIVLLLEQPDDVLLRRLLSRGLTDSDGVLLHGKKDEEAIRRHIAAFKNIVENYKKRTAGMARKWKGALEW